MTESCPGDRWLIRQAVGQLATAMDSELHKEASEFADWLTKHIGHYREVSTSESNPSLLPAAPVC